MKALYFMFFALLLVTSCNKTARVKTTVTLEKRLVIKDFEISKDDLVLNQIEGKWYYNNKPFSGYSIKRYPNDSIAERLGFVNGKREGIARKWSEKGVLRTASYYKHNRLDSVYKTWWENGVLSSQSNYKDGVKQGVEEEWYPTGQLAKQRQLVNGKENGLQKAWLQNGTLYVNYEAKNGRVFGMKRANSCYKLENEVINRNKKI
ncbi:hypothetical protein [uncultured Formosa sp.]|uniref:toxin-antitoxin system YwqK family antitoxin n=1 Tax=uncultured Formosa sp. TaxID=255435 RepID=UPI002634E198|nr:hypothetical protein [uncultured Formosa sp.]